MAEPTTPTSDDWVSGAVDTIVATVDKVKTNGTENLVVAIRGLVFGLVALVFGFAAIILTVIVLVRLADAYLPIGAGVGDATWAAHLLVGGMLTILGFGLWLSRKTESFARVWLAVVLDGLILIAIVCYGIVDAVR